MILLHVARFSFWSGIFAAVAGSMLATTCCLFLRRSNTNLTVMMMSNASVLKLSGLEVMELVEAGGLTVGEACRVTPISSVSDESSP